MLKEINEILFNIDKKIDDLNVKEVQSEFESIPLDIFGRIQIDRPPEYPNLLRWLPDMPSSEIQKNWTGSDGHILMGQSLAFIKTIISTYHAIACKPIKHSNVLDFGCGWGRLIRLLYKYVPADNIYGVDPWSKSIEICNETNIKGNLYVSEYIPRTLPISNDIKFDFIMAFSVFTHLSNNVTKICSSILRDYLSDNGVLAITIRPIEYWTFRLNHNRKNLTEDDINKLIAEHYNCGFSFSPHTRNRVEGEITYGDTTISLDYIRENFTGLEIVSVEFNEIDPQQLIVFLKKVS